MNSNRIDVTELRKRVGEFKEGKPVDSTKGEGVVLLKSYRKELTSDEDDTKYAGYIQNGTDIKFQAFNYSQPYRFLESGKAIGGETVLKVKYEIKKYGLVIQSMEIVEDCNAEGFINRKYIKKEKVDELNAALRESGVSEKGKEIIKEVMQLKENVSEEGKWIKNRVLNEQAAMCYHDNCRTGLLAHTVKCLRIYNGIKPLYDHFKNEKANDVMVVGLVLHDIGKIFEMRDGIYQKYSYVSHRGLGLEYITKYKDFIINTYDEEFYYMLYALIEQHHDQYGEKAATIYSLIAHKIDDLDATLTLIDDSIQNKNYLTNIDGTKMKVDGNYLAMFDVVNEQ